MTFLILPALFALLFAFPPVFKGDKAQSNPIGITRPKGPVNRDGSVTAYAHVQEKGEYRLSKLGAIAAGMVFPFLPFDPVLYLLQPIAMVFADQAVRFAPFTDWAGHGAEIIAAERDGAIGYREAEIERMRDDNDKQNVNVAAGLLRWEWLARIVERLGR
jgi:hypothetical protein